MMNRERPIITQSFFFQSQNQGSRNSETSALQVQKVKGKHLFSTFGHHHLQSLSSVLPNWSSAAHFTGTVVSLFKWFATGYKDLNKTHLQIPIQGPLSYNMLPLASACEFAKHTGSPISQLYNQGWITTSLGLSIFTWKMRIRWKWMIYGSESLWTQKSVHLWILTNHYFFKLPVMIY